MKMKRIVINTVCILLTLFILSGCAAQSAIRSFPDREFGKTDFRDMHYERYDRKRFDELSSKMRAIVAEGKSGKELPALYDEIISEATRAATQNSLINISYSQNPNDEKIISEKDEMLDIWIEIADEASKTIRDALLSSVGGELRKHLDTEEIKHFLKYEDLTERQKELASEENELVTEYERLMLNFDVTAQIDGETWTIDDLQEQSDKLDEDKISRIYDEIEKNVNLTAGGIMQELLTLRTEQAKLDGYDDYAEYQYIEGYLRDFTKEEAAIFENNVKKNVGPRYFNEISNNIFISAVGRDCKITAENVENYIGKYAKRISPEIYDSYKYMKKYHLCDFTSDSGKMDQGYTTELYSYNTPFIYNMCYENNSQTLSDSIHEFGHFTEMHYMPTENVLTDSMSIDIAEVHSQGMEMLCDAYYDEIFKEDSPVIRARHLSALLRSVVEGCIQDEFQQYLYSHPEASVNEMNQEYCSIRASYRDKPEEGKDYDYSWMYIMHTFSSPMYYISYATSALTALDIWTRAQENRDEAVQKYLFFTSFGANDYGYLELLEMCGMGDFRDEEYIEKVAGEVMDTALELAKEEAA